MVNGCLSRFFLNDSIVILLTICDGRKFQTFTILLKKTVCSNIIHIAFLIILGAAAFQTIEGLSWQQTIIFIIENIASLFSYLIFQQQILFCFPLSYPQVVFII